jgi:hypothetical protein
VTETAPAALNLVCEARTYPPYDPFHGTNAAMLWRRVTITTPRGTARLEQTDYGHPGRLNDWQFRGIDAALQPRSKELIALAAAATAV